MGEKKSLPLRHSTAREKSLDTQFSASVEGGRAAKMTGPKNLGCAILSSSHKKQLPPCHVLAQKTQLAQELKGGESYELIEC